ncbi:MAG: hypothetical protein FJ403_15645 [Verrucomicrobia bacterium]|nr:hypothetical protein [Verrucomicrobiota bacterium]
MAHITIFNELEASGPLKQLYDAALSRAGCVANIIKVTSRDAATAHASINFYVSLMKKENALSKPRKEMLAAVVSNINDCYY